MAPKKTTLPGNRVAKVAPAPEAVELGGGEKAAGVEVKVDLKKFDVATRKKAKDLIASGRHITGTESADLINTLHEELMAEDREEITEQEVISGVPNQLAIRYETFTQANKTVNFPVHFVAAVEGGFALYNETGKRISPMQSDAAEVSKLNKAAARNNAIRRSSRLPGETV